MAASHTPSNPQFWSPEPLRARSAPEQRCWKVLKMAWRKSLSLPWQFVRAHPEQWVCSELYMRREKKFVELICLMKLHLLHNSHLNVATVANKMNTVQSDMQHWKLSRRQILDGMYCLRKCGQSGSKKDLLKLILFQCWRNFITFQNALSKAFQHWTTNWIFCERYPVLALR